MKDFNHQKNAWGVIFDMDGVLIDSFKTHLLSWKKMLNNHGLDMSEAQFVKTFGWQNSDIFAKLFTSLKPEEYALLADEKEAAFRGIIALDFPEMDGACDLVAYLYKAGARLAIGSSAPPENVQAFLAAFPGNASFRATTDSSEIKCGKPDPEVFVTSARKIGVPPQRCVVVEDAPAGVEAGKAAGCAVIALTGTATAAELKQANLVVDSLRQLTPQIFKNLIQMGT
jgi:beta-phosphoglucomutase